ncbi:18416_t:CDS:2, partial [Acaulospora morrowiae]
MLLGITNGGSTLFWSTPISSTILYSSIPSSIKASIVARRNDVPRYKSYRTLGDLGEGNELVFGSDKRFELIDLWRKLDRIFPFKKDLFRLNLNVIESDDPYLLNSRRRPYSP